MEPNSEGIRDGLLSRLPQPANLADYRREVSSLLDKNEKRLLREKWGAGATWFFMVGLGVALLWSGERYVGASRAAWFGSLACYCLIFGAVELLKHFINRARVDLLKETKQLQLQVLELHDFLRKERAR